MRIFYCARCGARLENKAETCPACGFMPYREDPYDGKPALGAGGIGWSTRIGDAKFGHYQIKRRKIMMIWSLLLAVIVPALLFFFNGAVLNRETALVTVVIGGMFLLIGVFSALATKRQGKAWDGIVKDKRVYEKKRKVDEGNGDTRIEKYLEYVVYVECNNGRVEELTYRDDGTMYDYFQIGDFLHKHAAKNIRHIEKYDKSRDTVIFCAACGGRMDIRADFCTQCGCPLLKGQSI